MGFKEEHWSRGRWAFSIGFFLMRFANIEDAICKLKVSLDAIKALEKSPLATLVNDPPRSWHDLQVEEQAAKLIRQLENIPLEKYRLSKSKGGLVDLLWRLIKIKDTRNTLAHGTFAMKDGCTPETPNYCIFSRAQVNERNETVAEAKILHAKDMESQISESTHLEMGLASYAYDLMHAIKIETSPTTCELTLEGRVREGELSLLIGRFMVYMGEIESLVHKVYQSVLDPVYGEKYNSPIIKLNGYWDSLTLSRQIQNLLDCLPHAREYVILRKVIFDLKNSGLVKIRNTLSHARVCHQLSPVSESLALVAVRKTRKASEVITAKDIKSSICMASNFSDSLAEALAIARMSLVNPIKLG